MDPYDYKFTPWRKSEDLSSIVLASNEEWMLPFEWNDQAEGASRKPIVMISECEVFEDWDKDILLPNGDRAAIEAAGGGMMPVDMTMVRAKLFGMIDETRNLTWMIRTNKPQNINGMWPKYDSNYRPGPSNIRMHFPNLWIGTTIKNQRQAERRILPLLTAQVGKRFVHIKFDGSEDDDLYLDSIDVGYDCHTIDCLNGTTTIDSSPYEKIDWVIISVMDRDTVQLENACWVIKHCKNAGVPVFVKSCVGELPEELRVREFPE